MYRFKLTSSGAIEVERSGILVVTITPQEARTIAFAIIQMHLFPETVRPSVDMPEGKAHPLTMHVQRPTDGAPQ